MLFRSGPLVFGESAETGQTVRCHVRCRDRPQPSHRAARGPRAYDGVPGRAPESAPPPAQRRPHRGGGRAIHVQPHRGLRDLSDVPRRDRRHQPLLLGAIRPAGRALRRAPLHRLRRWRRQPPLRSGIRPRLGRRRRERDPRAGPQRLGGGAGERHLRPAPLVALPSRPRSRQTGPHGDWHRPRHGVGLARRS